MIAILPWRGHHGDRFTVTCNLTGKSHEIGSGATVLDALIEAEKRLRDELDEVQARLTNARQAASKADGYDDRRGRCS